MDTVLPGHASSCRPHLRAQVASVVLPLFCTALLVFSALGNILALRLACQKGRKMNSTGIYLVHLAVSDLLLTVALPGRVVYYTLAFQGGALQADGVHALHQHLWGALPHGLLKREPLPGCDLCPLGPRIQMAGRARLICVAVWTLAQLQMAPLLLMPMTTPLAGKLACMLYSSMELVLGLPLMVLVACAVGFCKPVGLILFCYVKISWTLCRTAWENPLSSREGCHRRACLLMLLVLGVVLVCFSPYHLNIMQFMARRLLCPPSCAQRRAFELCLQATVALMNMNCSFNPTIYFFASTYYRKWLLGILKLKASSSSPSSPGKASSETPSVTQARGSVCLAEHVV
ncbi:hypothetical protein P7K49_000234 [Saguinus oedipus]|uniref:G-protein coupled receptors family 1 profile domain-containing protein n=1 Tax=Saguinus oedipus TaxID=9490 RepID=A0ABQ9WB45_SAGOE|nr:hypothetical protein P7K49_000234 [Saguinus oedipus]